MTLPLVFNPHGLTRMVSLETKKEDFPTCWSEEVEHSVNIRFYIIAPMVNLQRRHLSTYAIAGNFKSWLNWGRGGLFYCPCVPVMRYWYWNLLVQKSGAGRRLCDEKKQGHSATQYILILNFHPAQKCNKINSRMTGVCA